MKTMKMKAAALVASMIALTGTASAAIPAEATAAITGIQTDGMAMVEAGWPVLAALIGAFVLIKLFKKVMGKVA